MKLIRKKGSILSAFLAIDVWLLSFLLSFFTLPYHKACELCLLAAKHSDKKKKKRIPQVDKLNKTEGESKSL